MCGLVVVVDDFDIVAAVEGAVGGFGSGEGAFDFDVEEEDEAYHEGDDEEGDGDEEAEDDEEDEEEEGEQAGEGAWESELDCAWVGGGLGGEVFHLWIVGMLGLGLSGGCIGYKKTLCLLGQRGWGLF